MTCCSRLQDGPHRRRAAGDAMTHESRRDTPKMVEEEKIPPKTILARAAIGNEDGQKQCLEFSSLDDRRRPPKEFSFRDDRCRSPRDFVAVVRRRKLSGRASDITSPNYKFRNQAPRLRRRTWHLFRTTMTLTAGLGQLRPHYKQRRTFRANSGRGPYPFPLYLY
ncbi:hypothetical protein PCANC_14667 [Puccinia coronata f. sp. avenae]|uniref:Uncharacterized protein n=1 Tax=Puccinia coronata f. sp. avenae TaxID=200324 RepID=A0A2N5T693_9BASI|nr:hypothetical protein PCANC_14667 [Puccinia coronata f. sp. avenae]PLW21029.1 hypothetical protein PCASD_15082 [Puccinia coronata f. sp. avenae]PLW48064.1 hypothetical protein PCASD_03602 [Puccinia coronata f. sp. avenae]